MSLVQPMAIAILVATGMGVALLGSVKVALARKLHDQLVANYGSVTCHLIHRRILGRPYYLPDRDEYRKFEEAGAHQDKCTGVVGQVSRWAVQLLMDEGYV